MKVPIKILLIEDSRADAMAMLAMMNAANEKFPNVTTHVPTLAEGLVARDLHDVVITDLHLPDSDGADTVRALYDPAGPPLYVHSVSCDEPLMVECGRAGALAFFPKGADAPCLLPTLLTGIGLAQRRREQHEKRCECDAKIEAHLEALETIRADK